MKKRIVLLLCAALFCAVLAVGASAQTTLTYTEAFTNPVANGADPFVLYDSGTYYLYATNDGNYGYIVYTSDDLVNWKARGYALKKNGAAAGGLWAPEVFKYGDTYYMVYTAQEHIGIATADSPLGPFIDRSGRLLEEIKTIDGHFFLDDDGKVYLYFVSTGDWSYNGFTAKHQNNIWGGEFDLATFQFVSGPNLLVEWEEGEWLVNEGPEMLKHNGTYYLTFSVQGYGSTTYSVHYATSGDPIGTFVKPADNTVLVTADPGRTDPDANLYGTGHHCFTTAPNGDLMIVYHAHRSGRSSEILVAAGRSLGLSFVEERRVCIDRAWFDEDGVLRAGDVNNPGHPTVTADVAPTGASAAKTVTLDDNFAALATLPTVYVSMYDGLDTNDGSKLSPFRTLDAAYAALPKGGTIVLRQKYDMQSAQSKKYGLATDNAYYVSPKVDGPILIRGEFSAVPVLFKFWTIQSDTYLDNIVLQPRLTGSLAGGNAFIECGQNNIVIGEGVSCTARPNSAQFPTLVGGCWQYGAESTTSPYKYYTASARPDSMLTTDKAYSLTVLGGTWDAVVPGSMKHTTPLEASAPNAKLTFGSGAAIRPGKVSSAKITPTADGAVITYSAAENAQTYRICDGEDNLIGYSDTTSFTDTGRTPGTSVTYTVTAYRDGACMGDRLVAGKAVAGDLDGDRRLTLRDALTLLADVRDGKQGATVDGACAVLTALACTEN